MPTQPKSTQPAFLLAGVLFTVIALIALIALFMLKSKADMTTQEVYPGASAPTISWIYVSDVSGSGDIGPAGIGAGFTTNEGTPKNIYVRGELVDLNGCHNLMQANVTLYRSGLVDAQSCAADTNNCYQATLYPEDFVGCDTPEETTVTFEKSFSLPNYVDPSDAGSPYDAENWVAYVHVSDNSELGNTLTEDYEVNSLAAFSVPNAINYGTVALGADSNAIQLTFSNTGNRDVDSDVYAVDDMVSNQSGFDNILASAVHYSLTSGFTYGTGDTAVAKAPSTDLALALVQQTDDLTIPTTDTYWKLRMPSSGVQGTYTNTVVFTAKAAAGGGGQTLGLPELGSLDYSSNGGVEQLFQKGDTVLVTNDTASSLKMISTITPSNPSQVASIPIMSSNVTSLVVYGNYIFLGSEDASNNFQIRSNLNGQEQSTITVTGGVKGIAVLGNYAYVLVGDHDIEVIDVTSKSSPSIVSASTLTLPNLVVDIKSNGDNIFVYSNEDQLAPTPRHGYVDALSVSTPDAPSIVGTYQTYPDARMDLQLYASKAYVAGNNSDYRNTLQVINISDPSNMSSLGSHSINNSNVVSITVNNDLVYIADDASDDVHANLNEVNAATPTDMSVVASALVGTAGTVSNIASTLDYIYVADKTNGIFRVYQVMPVVPPKGGK